MITLKRNEEVKIYQVELSLKIKTKQSPFISVLILALEQEEISAKTLRQYLLPSFPIRACANLLQRLEQQGYLTRIGGLGHLRQNDEARYSLTELGELSAHDKSFWTGEKGVYNVFISNSNLIEQRIIKMEKVDRPEDDRGNNLSTTPQEIQQYEDQVLILNKGEVLVEDIEKKCFQLKPAQCALQIQANGSETALKFVKDNQILFQADLDTQEGSLQEEILKGCGEFEYNEDNRAIMVEFNKDDLSFLRKINITCPVIKRNQFNSIEVENVPHLPANKQQAELWYYELLFKNMNQYFFDEQGFGEFAQGVGEPIQSHYKLKIPGRTDFEKYLLKRKDAFYQTAKIQTINYLNY